MSGETADRESGWTVDTLKAQVDEQVASAIRFATLRNSLLQEELDRRMAAGQRELDGRLADLRDRVSQRHDDLKVGSDQRYDDLRVSILQQITDMRSMLNERYETQTKALDAAFKAAEQAVQTALVSAEKAVGKAEAAADKRFESVNEFRKQLADQTATFPTRIEVSTRLDAVSNETTRNAQRIGELELRLTSRLDTAQAAIGGASEYRSDQRLGIGQWIQAALVILTMIGLLIVAFHK